MSEHVKEPECFVVLDDDRDFCATCGWSQRVVEIPYDRREDAAIYADRGDDCWAEGGV